MLHDTTLVQHIYLVRIAYGAQAMRDADGGAALHQALQSLLHQVFTLGVESAGGLIEDQDGRVLQYGTRYADALTLASAEPATAIR